MKRIVADLPEGGYNGGFSIEPHLAVEFHDASAQSSEAARYNSFIEYGRRLEKIISEVS